MTLPELKDWLSVVSSIVALVGVLFLIYRTFTGPDQKAQKNLGEMKVACDGKHTRIDEIILEIKKSIEGINYTFAHFKENEFNHIETNTHNIDKQMAALDGKMDVIIKLLSKDKVL